MTNTNFPGWANQYVSILGLPIQKPSLNYLKAICTAQLTTFPFENISKLLYYRDQLENRYIIPTDEDYIQKHMKYQYGGTCFTQNSKLALLLRHLGFSCYLTKLGDDHMAILVELPEFPNERLFVDCGAAAPIFAPVRFEHDQNNVSQFGSDQVCIKKMDNEHGMYQYLRYRNGKKSGKDWLFNVNIRYEFEDFHEIIAQSNRTNSTFMKSLRCQIWQLNRDRNVSLVNNVLTIRYGDGTSKEQVLYSITEIEEVLEQEFNLPHLPIREAIDVLSELGKDIFADPK